MQSIYYRPGVILRRYILLPTYLRYIKHSYVLDYYHKLQEQQWNSLEKNREIQARKLYYLLKYASENIPYYKRIVKERNIKISKDNVFDALSKFPFLTKKIIRENFNELYKFRDSKYYLNHTGGSTGEPIEFYQDKEYSDWTIANKFLYNSWMTWKPGDLIVKLWGAPRDIFCDKKRVMQYLFTLIHGQVVLNSYKMSEEMMEMYVKIYNQEKPKLIVAYAESLFELSNFIEQRGLELWRPEGIITSAGMLYPYMRDQIEKVFHSKVNNRYGSREAGDIACECEKHEGLHVNSLLYYLEIVNSNKNLNLEENTGEIAVTVLTNYTMPFIRYKIGDIGVVSECHCTCGREFPLLKNIEGRTTDMLITSKGERISGTALTTLMYEITGIARYQIVQKNLNELEFYIQPIREDHQESIVKGIQGLMPKLEILFGSRIKLEVKFISELSSTVTGKYRYIISNIS